MKGATYLFIFGTILVGIMTMIIYNFMANYPADIYTINNNQDEQGNHCVPNMEFDSESSNYYRGCGLPVVPPVFPGGKLTLQTDFCAQATGIADIQVLYINKETSRKAGEYLLKAPFTKGFCTNGIVEGGAYDVPKELIPGNQYYVRFISDLQANPVNNLHHETQTLVFTVEEQ